jgi:hypothetical protein
MKDKNSDIVDAEIVETTKNEGERSAKGAPLWERFLFMLLFLVVLRICEGVLALTMLVQFIYKAATGSTNDKVLSFGKTLGGYIYSIVQYQTFNTEAKPWPVGSWSGSDKPAQPSPSHNAEAKPAT